MLVRVSIVMFGCLILVGCASPQERAQQQAYRAAQVEANDDTQCASYGAMRGTNVYIQCRMSIAQQRAQFNAALIGAVLARPMPQPYIVPAPPQPQPTVNCTTNVLGQTAYTNCR
jgi:hypothetical protein